MATLSISEYYDDPANWEAADLNYLGLLNVVGGGANTSHSDTALAILQSVWLSSLLTRPTRFTSGTAL